LAQTLQNASMARKTTKHAHHHDHMAGHLSVAEGRCSAHGEALTPLRRQVLSLLLQQPGPAKAYDLLDALKREHAAAKPPTIYRALEFLVRLGLAHRIESLNAYVACAGEHEHAPAVFLICDQCQRATELDAKPALDKLEAAAGKVGFSVMRTMVEAHGVCAECRKAG
jgi:Fur family transcriptional regulator, zinc uptake regulator